jgi:hypothetical protein
METIVVGSINSLSAAFASLIGLPYPCAAAGERAADRCAALVGLWGQDYRGKTRMSRQDPASRMRRGGDIRRGTIVLVSSLHCLS